MIDDDREMYELAERLASAGRGDAAIAQLQAVVQARDSSGRLWELLGTLAYDAADQGLALAALEHASILKPLSAKAQLALAKCYIDAGHREAATTVLRHLAGMKHVALELLEPLASGLGRCGQYDAALDVCRRAAQRMPDNPEPLIGIAHYMRRLRRPVELILPVLFRAHQLEPDNVEMRITLAWLLHESGRSREGACLLEHIHLARFSCVRCLTLMKQIFQHVGDCENAGVCGARLKTLAGRRPDGHGGPTVVE